LEFDLRYNLKLRANFESKIKLLEENLSMRDQELYFLKERLRNYDENSNEEQFKIFENEINNIREMLKEKTMEFLKMETRYKKTSEDFSLKYKKIKDTLENIKEENNKYSESLLNISSNLESNNTKKISEIIKSLNLTNQMPNNSKKKENKDEKSQNDQKTDESMNKIMAESSSIPLIDQANNYPANSEETFVSDIIIGKNENTFANKVIEEFDKVFNKELKRIERYYKKSDKNADSPLLKRSSISQRRASTDRNYVIWNGKSPNVLFNESLRSDDNSNYSRSGTKASRVSINNSTFYERKNSQLNQSMNIDMPGLINQAKERVRSSISIKEINRNYNNTSVSNFSYNDQNNLKYNYYKNGNLNDQHSPNKVENFNNSKMNYYPYGIHNNPNLISKKNKKENLEREYFNFF
jgi:hypothetical protein